MCGTTGSITSTTLLFWEVMFVAAVAIVVYLKTQRDSRRFKVRPGQRLR